MTASRTILVTGCSSGIGLATAQTLARQGWRVLATVRRLEDAIQGEGIETLLLDQTDSAAVQACAAEALARCEGQLDAVFCNAGLGVPGAVEDLSRDAMRFQFETNVFGTIELINALLPAIRRQGHGRILINSSILGFAAMPYRGAYNASKYALEGFADTLRQELIGTDIHVSLIEPGPIASRFRANAQAQFARWIDAQSSVHRLAYQAMAARLAKAGPAAPFTLPASAVADVASRCLNARYPAARYRVTIPTRVFWYLKRLLPTRWLDWIALKASGDEPGYVYGRKP
ncbi:Short-chain dehydrogenase [Formivibrio citricus]|uniref:Short-chain dehydrogenase n=1 Tax=Formivibrio citricus TaxID=83765 RepID=A0A1I5BFW7_9NEIS|nr:SDR family NAD(P)-dependent oxidoreductase [Formivibrio citricus]SFN73557.1 Short-chain dehydrogenase [Formivibrio citricus]